MYLIVNKASTVSFSVVVVVRAPSFFFLSFDLTFIAISVVINYFNVTTLKFLSRNFSEPFLLIIRRALLILLLNYFIFFFIFFNLILKILFVVGSLDWLRGENNLRLFVLRVFILLFNLLIFGHIKLRGILILLSFPFKILISELLKLTLTNF